MCAQVSQGVLLQVISIVLSTLALHNGKEKDMFTSTTGFRKGRDKQIILS